jgi:hypothetical protein
MQQVTDQLSDKTQFSKEDAPRGRASTLIVWLALLVLVYSLTYIYVLPRLGQELVSATTSLQFRASSAEPQSGWPELAVPDGTKRNVNPEADFSAVHFSGFRHVFQARPPQVILLLSEEGARHRWNLQQQNPEQHYVIMLNSRPIAEIAPDQWTATQVTVTLTGLSSSQTNEVLARLTE